MCFNDFFHFTITGVKHKFFQDDDEDPPTKQTARKWVFYKHGHKSKLMAKKQMRTYTVSRPPDGNGNAGNGSGNSKGQKKRTRMTPNQYE